MRAFEKVLKAIEGKPENGHAVGNQKNILALKKVAVELEGLLRGKH